MGGLDSEETVSEAGGISASTASATGPTLVERALHTTPSPIEDMRVDHRRAHIPVPR